MSRTAGRPVDWAGAREPARRGGARRALPRRRMLDVVDLRALELAGVVDVDRLPLREDVERRLARLAVAVAGLLHAAERQVHLRARRARVDVRDPGLKVAHRFE